MDLEDSIIAQAKTEHEILIEESISARKRKRDDKRRRRKYKFTDKKHSVHGVISTCIAVTSIALVVVSIAAAVSAKGQAGIMVGILPFISLVMSTVGIILSCITFRKPDTIFTFSWIGLIANIVVWLFVALVLVSGI